jgi:MoaA/NifB/PqqE/SkfB family radical SAM enzyme
MCYYTYSESDWSKPVEEVKGELRQALERGNTTVDFTGGEPTIYPQMAEVIKYAESIGLHTCIITNGLAVEKVKKLTDAGCSEWLLSVHGFDAKQDELLQVNGAWEKINKTIHYLNDSGSFIRINCTLTRYNFEDLPKLASYYDKVVKPHIINFINFNPHYEWGKHQQPEIVHRLNEVQVKAAEVAPFLKEAIDYLSAGNYWVNVRYFPLCLLKGYESHVCNNPQVMFDPYEWDYGISPKTPEAYLAQGRDFQRRINTREGVCASCGMLDVCGGLHSNYAKLHGWSELEPYSERSDNPYHFKSDLAADIVVPAFKPGENLKNLLSEIAEKTIPPYNLQVISKQQSAARNRNDGLRASQNPYVIMCDDDICDLPFGWNRALVWTLKENREILGISARLMTRDGKIGRNTINNFDLTRRLVDVEMIPTACCIFRKSDVMFDERYIRAGWEDTDFFLQMRKKFGGKFAIENTIRVIHLNEEKNCGGLQNSHNEGLFFSKWAPEDYESLGSARKQSGEPDRKIEAKGPAKPELQDLYQAVLLNPTDMDAFDAFIQESYRSRRFQLLEDCLAKLLQTFSNAKELRYLFASCLFEQAKYESARQVAEELVSSHPEYPASKALLEQINVMATRNLSVRAKESTEMMFSSIPVPGPYPRMKLLVGPGLLDSSGTEAFLVKGLKKAAEVKTFDHTAARFEDVLRGLPAGWTPDAILVRDAEYYKIPPGIEQAEPPVFCLLGDYNLSFNQMLPILGAFDHIFCDMKGVRILRNLGFDNCEYFCLYGFDPELHREYGLPRDWDVVFIGNLNHSVQQERETWLYKLARLRNKYRVYIGTAIRGTEYGRFLNRSRLVFNRPIRDEANMRFFEALGCGAFVLNPHLEELDVLGFHPGEHYLHYGDLEAVIEDYLENWSDSRRLEKEEKIGQVLQHHTYDRRAEELVQKISRTKTDTSRRTFGRLTGEDIRKRWELHHSEECDMNGLGKIGRYDPIMVGWQTHIASNELDIKNFDFNMWAWWMNLLTASGLTAALASFVKEKEELLEAFGCYKETADKIKGLGMRLGGVGIADNLSL